MKNKIFNSLLIIITLFIVFSVKVNAKEITINTAFSAGYQDIYCENYFSNCPLRTIHKQATDSSVGQVYCADHDVALPPGGPGNHIWTCSDPKDGTLLATKNIQVGYAIKNGPKSNLGEYLITQFAVWHYIDSETADRYFDFKNKTYINGGDSTTTANTTTLMNLVAKADTEAGKKPSIEIKTDSTVLTQTSDGKYLISKPITINATNSKINNVEVSGIEGIFITTNKDNKTGTKTLNPNAAKTTVYIKIPIKNMKNNSISVALDAKSSGTVDGADYCTNSDNWQPLVIYSLKTIDKETSKNFTATKYNVLISKTDIAGSKEIPGAHLVVKNSGGSIIEEWTSTEKAHDMSLLPGKYVLTETIAPEGYVLSESKLLFEVKSNGTVMVGDQKVDDKLIKFINEPIIIKILKTNLTGKEEVEGAHLNITDKNGEIAYDVLGNKLEWVSTKEPVSFSLKPGTYILTETIAPEGYELSETSIEFVVTDKNKVLIDNEEVKDNLIIFENEPSPIQVPTGSAFIYILFVGLCSFGLFMYFFNKKEGLIKRD